ncbi:MAG: hypothetical protein FJ263_00945 [Planctomycetes bacterium]|nr:hypothetical protein [Planctomycetota bacterium]
MKKVLCVVVLAVCVVLSGCEGFRFAAKEEQKQNAYLHWRVTELAAAQAKAEETSPQLQGLTGLASQQSRAFVADYGMPRDSSMATQAWPWHPSEGFATETAIAATAYQQSMERPGMWEMADGAMELGIGLAGFAMELGIGLAGLLGGVYGIRATQFLKQAREKSKALKEIIEGNELFKENCPSQAAAFKDAQAGQSAETRKIVTEVKAST